MTTCFMLVDMQRGILQSARIPWESQDIPSLAIESANRLLAAARRVTPVVHVGVVRPLREGAFDQPRTQAAIKSGKAPRQVLPMVSGSADVEFVCPPSEAEEIIHKVGVSAFAGTRAEMILRNYDTRDVVVAGAFTHMAVESTVRQGFDLGFRMHVAAAACCSPTKALHDAALSTGIANFARVLGDIESAVKALEDGRSAR
jgi:nicotinamidase-related amidase